MMWKTIIPISILSPALVVGFGAVSAYAEDYISIKGGTVYDTTGKQIVSGTTAYDYVSGTHVCPVAKIVTASGATLKKKNEEFLVYYFGNSKPGTATAVIRGIHKAGYKDAIILKYKIRKQGSSSSGSSASTSKALDITKTTAAAISDQIYTGKALTPSVSLYYNGKKVLAKYYKVSYAHNVAIGTATATVTGNGDVFQGTKSVSFNIVAATGTFKVGTIAAQKYTGAALTPKPYVSSGNTALKENVDYKLSYADNVNIGTAKVMVIGLGAYARFPKKTVTFKITNASSTSSASSSTSGNSSNAKSISAAKVTMKTKLYTTSLWKVTPKPTVKIGSTTLKAGRDYAITYKNNLRPGTATMTLTGKGGYSGTKSVKFTLVNMGDDLAKAACKISYSRKVTGGAGTKAYIAAAKKAGCYWAPYYGRSCIFSMRSALYTSGYDPAFPKWNWSSNWASKSSRSYFHYLRKGETSSNTSQKSNRWTYVGTYPKDSAKLMPGDVLLVLSANNSGSNHIWMYVGNKIAKQVYNSSLKGTDADKGIPTGAWVQGHGSNKSAPSIEGPNNNYNNSPNPVRIYRCTSPKCK